MIASLPIFSAALPEIILACGSCVLLLLGTLNRPDILRSVNHLAKLLILLVLFFNLTRHQGYLATFNGMFILDNFAVFLKVLILLFGYLILLASDSILSLEHLDRPEYPIFILFAILGMMIMVSSGDFLVMFMGLELQSISLYILVAINHYNKSSLEAGLKYLILGALATAILLFGISFIYGFTGTTNFHKLSEFFRQNPMPLGVLIGWSFVLTGLSFKIAVAPFHMWLPDVYEGAPISVVTFLAVVPKIAVVGLLLRLLLGPFNSVSMQWIHVVTIIAVISLLWGAFGALNQQKFKRLLAYSTIGNMGYVLIGIVSGGVDGVRATLIYLSLYAMTTFGVFTCLLSLLRQGRSIDNIAELRGLTQTSPFTGFILAFMLFSLAGLPPLAGFFGKLYIFQAAICKGFYWLAIISVIAAVIAAAYYLYVIKVIVMDNPKGALVFSKPARYDNKINIILLGTVAILIFCFFNPSHMISITTMAAKSLINSQL